jgi:DNA-binding NarL/FixJ family response regulator
LTGSTGAIVSQRNVIILSSRGLFREGIKRLLADVADVSLATSRAEVRDQLRNRPIDTVIVDQQDAPAAYGDLIWQLLSWPAMRVITVSLDMTDIQIYQHQQVTQASPEALIAAVTQ